MIREICDYEDFSMKVQMNNIYLLILKKGLNEFFQLLRGNTIANQEQKRKKIGNLNWNRLEILNTNPLNSTRPKNIRLFTFYLPVILLVNFLETTL